MCVCILCSTLLLGDGQWDALHPREEGENCGLGVQSSPEPWARELDTEAVFTKHTYDAFQSGDMSASLRAHLQARGVTRLYLCGVLTKVRKVSGVSGHKCGAVGWSGVDRRGQGNVIWQSSHVHTSIMCGWARISSISSAGVVD